MICIVGAGAIGKTIADYLSQKHEVSVIDLSQESLDHLRNVKKLKGTIEEHQETVKSAEVVIVALPGGIAFGVVKKLILWGKKVVDISFSDIDPMELDETAKKNKALLIPDAGFAPGISNILAGRLYNSGKYSRIEIYCAGLPQEPKEPLLYTVNWSVEGLIDEYTRPARIIQDGREKIIDPLENIGCYHVEGLGDFEAFYSDGLRTLLKTLDCVDMFEKTLRFKGHLDRVKLLRDLGYFSSEDIGGVSPRVISEGLLERLRTGEKDVCVLIVRGVGKETSEFSCVDYYDESEGVSSMSRMTGYTAAIIAEGVAEGKINGTGVLPPEKIGFVEESFNFVREKLGQVGIRF